MKKPHETSMAQTMFVGDIENLPAPAVVVVAGWDTRLGVPTVYPSRRARHDPAKYAVHRSAEAVRAEIEKMLLLPWYQARTLHAVPADEVQAFMDAEAARLVEAYQDGEIGPLRVYGFTEAELRKMGIEPVREEGTVL